MTKPTAEKFVELIPQIMAIDNLEKELIGSYIKNSEKLAVLGPTDLQKWFDLGLLKHTTDGFDAAQHYFEMETESSLMAVRDMEYGVSLKNNATALSRFCKCLDGKNWPIEPSLDGVPCTDGKKLFLPEQISYFLDAEENRKQYRANTLHERAHIADGTYKYKLTKEEEARLKKKYGTA
jgi:hypothetical protein